MEYAPGGNLYDYIRAQGEPLPEEKVWQLFIQVRAVRWFNAGTSCVLQGPAHALKYARPPSKQRMQLADSV